MLLSNAAQIRRADQIMIEEYNYPGLLLMETAGRKAAEFIIGMCSGIETILVLAGPGNNGGDGIVIARYLHQAGLPVKLLFSAPPENLAGDAAINFKTIENVDLPWTVWPDAPKFNFGIDSLLVDAMLGTGVSTPVRGPVAEMIKAFSPQYGPVVAIDIPSGLNVDTGLVHTPPILADVTLTFQLPKIAHAVSPAAHQCGEVVVVDLNIWPQVIDDLGITRHWVNGELVKELLEPRQWSGHKGTYGHALLIGGSNQYPGAIALSGHAALHVGAGLSTVAAPKNCHCAVFGIGPEAIFHQLEGETVTSEDLLPLLELSEGKAIGLGPGWSTVPPVKAFFLAYLEKIDWPIVLDADALNLLAETQCWDLVPAMSILTPHPKEMQRLLQLDAIPEDRLEAAESLARQRDVIVILKGSGSIIASPTNTWVNSTGNPGMGTGGAGDVLTGMVTGLLAQGYDPEPAAIIATYLHGLAGDWASANFTGVGVTAGRILASIGPAWNQLEKKEEPQIETI